MAQATVWKGSMQRTAWAARCLTTVAIHPSAVPAPSADTSWSWAARCGPSASKNAPRTALPWPFGRPDQPAGVVVHDHGQVPLALAIGHFVDRDAGQPVEKVDLAGGPGDDPGHDPVHGAKRDPHERRDCRRGHVRGHPRDTVLERGGEPGTRMRPARPWRRPHRVQGRSPGTSSRPGRPRSRPGPGRATGAARRLGRSPGSARRTASTAVWPAGRGAPGRSAPAGPSPGRRRCRSLRPPPARLRSTVRLTWSPARPAPFFVPLLSTES